MSTRIYLVQTKSGGRVRASFTVGQVYEILYYGGGYARVLEDIRYANKRDISHDVFIADEDFHKLEKQGYTDQKHTIEILDVKKCDYHINDFTKHLTYDEIQVAPQSFVYIDNPCPYEEIKQGKEYWEWEPAIMMPIKQPWLKMILDGKKTWLFTARLPRLLRGE